MNFMIYLTKYNIFYTQALITSDQIANEAKLLKKPLEEIQQRYAALALRFGLKLA